MDVGQRVRRYNTERPHSSLGDRRIRSLFTGNHSKRLVVLSLSPDLNCKQLSGKPSSLLCTPDARPRS
jgi:hypothetical protein